MDYYVKCLQNYVNFEGRARRTEYWTFALFNAVIAFMLAFVGAAFLNTTILNNIFSAAMFLPSIAVGARRMHDVGKSGWYLLIPIYSLILAFTEGESGPNQYGPDPKDPGAEDPNRNPFEKS